MAEWSGKERRTKGETRTIRRNYRWNRFFDSLVEDRTLIAVAMISVFTVLAVLAIGISNINRRNEADGEKTRLLIRCVVGSFAMPAREDARIHLARCIEED